MFSGDHTLFTTFSKGWVWELDTNGVLLWEKLIGGKPYSVEPERKSLWASDVSGSRAIRISREGAILQKVNRGKDFVGCRLLELSRLRGGYSGPRPRKSLMKPWMRCPPCGREAAAPNPSG
jgi:hypothetical protein